MYKKCFINRKNIINNKKNKNNIISIKHDYVVDRVRLVMLLSTSNICSEFVALFNSSIGDNYVT